MAETSDQRGSGATGGGAGGASAGAGGPALPPELQARVREGIELLRPHPHRGDLIAGGAVPLTVALLLINLRLDDSWGNGVFFVLNLLACAIVLGMGVLAPMEEETPRAYQLVLQLSGLVLLFVTLMRLAQVFGVQEPLGSAWTAFLILAVMTAAAAWLARERRSEVCTLIAGITGTFALLAFVDLVFSPDGAGTTRWLLLFAAILLLGGSLVLRDRHRRESVYLIDAAGVAILVLGITFIGELLFGAVLSFGSDELLNRAAGPGVLWKVALLASGLGLVAFAGVDNESGPGYLGALILLIFVLLVGAPGEGGPSLWFWPLVLLLIGAAMIAAGLRPRQPLPPEPARGDPAPVVPAPVPSTSPPAVAAAIPPFAAAPPAPERMRARPPLSEAASAPPAGTEPSPAAAAGPESADDGSEFIEPAAGPAQTEADAPAWMEPPAAEENDDPPTADAPVPEEPPRPPEPPARGSLWARADPGEEPTRPHRVPPRDSTDE
ncbi:hypothetical protein [Conexibacter sp. CPCC 206217]|uniref:hypothetical protein n=1 Tax=Conexibacter sp. CPCC 206217 TaxID=3064574 RepID=UPI0027232984|nr:hypothetical protein [Conexibacter sp. CPCC 206217]MDO8213440.1 hypothetical protein [Conexibacter sp. CPCC 206217]